MENQDKMKIGDKRRAYRQIKSSFSRIKDGYSVGTMKKGGELPRNLRLFGCLKCSWVGTELCPHGIKIGEHHTNWICSNRALYIKDQLDKMNSVPRVLQNEIAMQLKLLTDRMLWEYAEYGELHDDFKHLNKNLITIIDKMRKQDEGVKVQGELDVTLHDFRKVIDEQAEAIDGKSILEAEFEEEETKEVEDKDKNE